MQDQHNIMLKNKFNIYIFIGQDIVGLGMSYLYLVFQRSHYYNMNIIQGQITVPQYCNVVYMSGLTKDPLLGVC